jgi:hypothetical protein
MWDVDSSILIARGISIIIIWLLLYSTLNECNIPISEEQWFCEFIMNCEKRLNIYDDVRPGGQDVHKLPWWVWSWSDHFLRSAGLIWFMVWEWDIVKTDKWQGTGLNTAVQHGAEYCCPRTNAGLLVTVWFTVSVLIFFYRCNYEAQYI